MKQLLRLFPTKWWEIGTLLCVGVLPAVMLFFFLRGQAASPGVASQDWEAPVIEVKQLPVGENGVIPVEILRAKAYYKSQSEIQELIAVVQNNTDKIIMATSLEISISSESNGVRSVKTSFVTSDSFVHPDIYRANKAKPFGAKDVQLIESAAMAYPAGTLVKGISINLDYVEFNDGTTAGPDRDGSRVIYQTRMGAAKYKEWLEQQYINGGRSVPIVLSAIEAESLPSDLKLGGYLTHGAYAYQRHMREAFKLQGAEEVIKQLSNKPAQ